MSITIGLPFFNPGPALEKAVRSVFSQTIRDWTLLLLDDGSTDSSLDAASRIRDSRVRVISDGMNRGLPTRLNQLAELASTDLLCRMDADDLMHPDRLRRQQEFLDRHPYTDVVGTYAISIDEHDRPRGVLRKPDPSRASFRELLAMTVFIHPSILGRRAWFLEHPYDASFSRAEDHELWCRTADSAGFANISEPLLYYREPNEVNVRAYLMSCRTDRQIFRRFGPARVGIRHTATLVARSMLKGVTYRAASSLGMSHRLVRRRSAPLDSTEIAAHRATIDRVLRTDVPGWPAPQADSPAR